MMKQKIATPVNNAQKVVDAIATAFPSPAAVLGAAVDFLAPLRLSQKFGESLKIKKRLTTVPVRKPLKTEFCRVHPGSNMRMDTMALVLKHENETYLLTAEACDEVYELAQPVTLHTAIDRKNNVFILPIALPGEDGRRNPWHQSLAEAAFVAETNWVRIVANMNIGGYDMYVATGEIPEPVWPDVSFGELIQIAFKGRIIDDPDHPVIKMIRGDM